MSFYRALSPLIFSLDPETAHGLAMRAIGSGLLNRPAPRHGALASELLGLRFPNPVGLAAGFDKNAELVDHMPGLGFGFAEIGTVTPLPQPGNPRPRMFRLTADRAAINRLGFNNEGADVVFARLARRRGGGLVGVNIGANKDSPNRIDDYVSGVARFSELADYLTINISSPNTPGLRDLQAVGQLRDLLAAIRSARTTAVATPILVKLAPDIADVDLAATVETIQANGMDGIIVSNTTLARDGIPSTMTEAGGVSGRPLFRRSTRLLARVRQIVGPDMVLVGVGGVDSTETAWAKFTAGADLVQFYTGMVFEGPHLAARIVDGLAERVTRASIGSLRDIVGTETARWANETV